MNERIKLLALQAGLIAPYGSDHEGLGNFDYRKFAELIVQECADQFKLVHTDEQYQRRIDKTILKHFGLYK